MRDTTKAMAKLKKKMEEPQASSAYLNKPLRTLEQAKKDKARHATEKGAHPLKRRR